MTIAGRINIHKNTKIAKEAVSIAAKEYCGNKRMRRKV